jgi:hypothetical protein
VLDNPERDCKKFDLVMKIWPIQREISISLIQVERAANLEIDCKEFNPDKKSWKIQREIARSLIEIKRAGQSRERLQEV